MIPVRLCRMVICVKEPNVAFVMWDLVAYRSKVPSCDHKGLLSCAYIGLIRTFEQQHRGELFLAFGVLILLVPPNYGVGLDDQAIQIGGGPITPGITICCSRPETAQDWKMPRKFQCLEFV